MSNIAYLSLGSNLGDRMHYLKNAIQALDGHPNIKVLAASSVYETDPVGYTDQGKFLNMAVKIETSLVAQELLETCLEIEKSLGRVREIKWGPRTIDLDILLYNNENIETDRLVIPHPRMNERLFVLIPILEIDPFLKIPTIDKPLIDLFEQIPNKEGVRLWKQINGEDVYALFGS
ncbi:MAG: 2-amino-4-hydroxy-6-hydroxymethyldihydropteridine diphosphokinase [Bacillales bacterium]|nr:2-amino-4-hydroxy-6-hydroxymethyldihydropteridine diphosphokinase [Bacillales bacterium]